MPANSPYPGESQEQFAMRQQENTINKYAPGTKIDDNYTIPNQVDAEERARIDRYRQQQNYAGVRKAIAQRFPDALPDELNDVFQAYQAFAEGQGGQPDLEQFFQQYEAAPQGFGGREVNQELPPELLARMQQGQPGPPMGGQYS